MNEAFQVHRFLSLPSQVQRHFFAGASACDMRSAFNLAPHPSDASVVLAM